MKESVKPNLIATISLMASDIRKPSSSRQKVMLKPGFHLVDWMRQMQAMKITPGKLRKISLRELSEHKSQYDCWTAYKGKVYNITQYLPYHPGGIPILMQAAGKDCTVLFNKYHSWVNAESMLSKCIVGVMMTEEEEGDLVTNTTEQATDDKKSPPQESANKEHDSDDDDKKINSSIDVSFRKLDLSSAVSPASVLTVASSVYGYGSVAPSSNRVLDALSEEKNKEGSGVHDNDRIDK